MISNNYVKIDEEGFALFGETRVTDQEIGQEILKNIRFAENGAFVTNIGSDGDYLVESFDAPLVAQSASHTGDQWTADFPYGYSHTFKLSELSIDEWDRFHGLVGPLQIPFVFSRKAQAQFFDGVDELTDDGIQMGESFYRLPNYLIDQKDVQDSTYWSHIYQTEDPKWELNRPSPVLVEMLPKLRLPRQRVLILGSGSGNDAALFAQAGHLVTAVDFSSEAIEQAKKKYGHLQIQWVCADVFNLPIQMNGGFDLIFEHTCFCAVNPALRNKLIGVWKRLLADNGHLFAVLFTMEKKMGPPFGGTEWEYRERLKKHFQFIYWGRWRQSIQGRDGKELFIYAKKTS